MSKKKPKPHDPKPPAPKPAPKPPEPTPAPPAHPAHEPKRLRLPVPHDAPVPAPAVVVAEPFPVNRAELPPLPNPVIDVSGTIMRQETWYGSVYFVFTPDDGESGKLCDVLDTGHVAKLSLS
jgi:hypothetical protein